MNLLSQLIANGIITGMVITLIALGFAIIYITTRFFHFAHGIVFTAGAYFTFLFKNQFGLPFWFAIPIAILACTALGCLIEILIYRPLRHKGSSSLILLLASLGIYIVLQNIVSMVFGDDTKIIRSGIVKEGINFLGARITPVQITIIIVSLLLVVSCFLFLKYTKTGQAMRAVANDPKLARVSGIESDRVIFSAFALGSALAGIAGILVALDVDMTPTMGMNALLLGVVAVIIGGVGSIPGIAMGALFLGMAQHLGAWNVGSQWQDAIAFVILLILLLFRPQGFLGKKVKTAML
jgi:branched-chain amino acid transport system permease protein